MKNAVKMFVVFLMLFPAYAGSAYAGDKDEVLATVGKKTIRQSDIDRIISYYPEEKKKMFQSPQNKATLLKRIVQAIVLSDLAKKKGFDKRADIREQADLFNNDFIATQYMMKEVVEKIKVTEEDKKLYYKAHQDEFMTPEMVKARHILILAGKAASEEDKKKAKEKAEDILKKAKAGEDFTKLASEFSEDPGSKPKGGDLGFFQRGRMVPEFDKAAFALKPGEISGIVETMFGFHIIKVDEKKEAVIEPYEQVKDKAAQKVFSEFQKARVEEFVDKAMKDAGVEFNLEPLQSKN